MVRRPGGDFVTSEEYMQRRLPKEYPEGVPKESLQELNPATKPTLQDKINQQILQQQEQLQNPKIEEYNRVNKFTRPVGAQSSANIKPGSQEIASAGISQYTLLNGPENNTIIVQPSGGGMPPPPAQPPQMIAQAPPLDMQMMGGGPSKLDQVLALNTLITFTKLTS